MTSKSEKAEDAVKETKRATKTRRKSSDTSEKSESVKRREKNLEPMKGRALSTEEARKMGAKGGKASVEARRHRKAISETWEAVLRLRAGEGKLVTLEDIDAIEEAACLIVAERIVLAQASAAMDGDYHAYDRMLMAIGESTPVQVETTMTVMDHDKLKAVQKLINTDPQVRDAIRRVLDDDDSTGIQRGAVRDPCMDCEAVQVGT